MYDVTDRTTFDKILSWIEEIESNSTEKLLRVLLANKVDSEDRQVTEVEGRMLAQRYGINYFEVSAKSGLGVNEAFTYIAETLVSNLESEVSLLPRQSFSLKEEETVIAKPGCCG